MESGVRPDVKTEFIYVGIRVKDLEESIKFYTTVLGMKLTDRQRIDETKGDVAGLQSGNVPGLKSGKSEFALELNHYDDDSPYNTKYTVGEGLDHLAFKVDDIDKAIRVAKREGYDLLHEVKTKSSRWAYIKDPNGIWIELVT
jgi:methylmalonyl-CoA/ethylmalonyl-CoA epimerase